MTFNLKFPGHIEKPNNFNPNGDIDRRRYSGIPEFELEFLLKQILINCDDKTYSKTLKSKDTLAKLINYSRKTLSEGISKISLDDLGSEVDFLFEFNRMTHRQFNWQVGYNHNIIFRYYKIYNDEKLSEIILKKFGLSTYELFIMGFFLFQHTANYFRIPYPIKSDSKIITDEMLKIFFENFAINIEDVKNELKEYQEMNENLYYSYNTLLSKPIILNDGYFICPMQLLLFWRITSGLYYSIVKEKGFENAFGSSFENYIGEFLHKSILNKNISIFPEEVYGKPEKRTTDWILVEKEAILFIECKTKRMTIKSKTQLDIKEGLHNDIKKMAGFILQLYKSFLDYYNNLYPNVKYDKSKNFIPLLLTLETWYVNFNPRIMNMLNDYIIEEFEKNNLDKVLLEKHPYHIRSTEDFERDILIINELGIKEYFHLLNTGKLDDKIKDFEYDYPFSDEFHSTFIQPLKDVEKNGS